jgi:hypothetical protein
MASPWLLVISKHPQYTDSGEVMLGQCEPYTPGWRLRLFREGEEQVLLEGTYYDLRKVQADCADKPVEEIKKIAAEAKIRLDKTRQSTAVVGRAEDLGGSDTAATQTQVPVESTQLLGSDEINQALEQFKRAGHDDDETGEYVKASASTEPFEVVKVRGVVVATLLNLNILDDPAGLEKAFDVLMKESQGALVVDIARVQKISAEAASAIGQYTAKGEETGRFVALANVRDEVVADLQEMESAGRITGILVAYPEVEGAVSEAKAFLDKSKT